MQEEAVASFRPSPQQEQIWLREPDGPTSRNQAVVEISGPLDAERLRRAIATAVGRHEILRTTFQRQAGMRVPLQVVADELPAAWEEIEVASSTEVAALADVERSVSVDYEAGPLVRAALALGADQHALILTAYSVCMDLASLATFVREIAALYGESGVAEEPLQYADFAEWQHELLQADDEDAERARAFWASAREASPPEVPFLHVPQERSELHRTAVGLSEETLGAVEATAEQFGVEGSMLVLTAWSALLARLSGTHDLELAVVLPERQHVELEAALGAFSRAVPVRLAIAGETTFAEALDRVARAVGEAAKWQDYLAHDAAVSAVVGFRSSPEVARFDASGVSFALRELALDDEAQPVTLDWALRDGRMQATVSYDAGAFKTAHAERLARQLERVLALVTSNPKTTIDDIDLLSDEERQEIVYSFNSTSSDVRSTTIDALVREAATRRPAAVAVVDDSNSITYAELDACVNQVAHRLRGLGIGAGNVVGLCMDRSIDMVVALLGILRAGAAYLPLHYEHPPARLAHQLAETGAPAVLTLSGLIDRLPSFGGEVITLDRNELSNEPTHAPDPAGTADDLVYVMYTSGSTGTPKGVAVTNANLTNYVGDMIDRLGAGDEAWSFGLVTAISTDLGNTSVFPALCSGGTLSLVSPAVAADPGALTARMREHPVDVLKITPSHLNALLVGADASAILPRRWLIVGGEACSWDLVARVRELSECRMLNHYGPTETTVGSCTFLVEDGPGPYAPATAPIGRPISNTACYVLDERGRPAPLGVVGGLFIAGAGVARGYVGQPELTERFVTDPFGAVPGGRMYATGDLARWLPDGTLEFLGRADEQVKIRGFRVEPAEIESALRAFPGVPEAAVVARDEGGGDKRLIAYVASDGSASPEQLRAHLAERVPDFMIPSAFVALAELPRTASGKIDRLGLPEPDAAASASSAYVGPRTPMEEKVAAIWADVLGLDKVSVTDDFFALGGHSLLATQIVAQIRSDLAIELPLHSLFTSPTIESLSTSIVELMGGDGVDSETAELLAQLETLSDEEAERLLAGDSDSGAERS